jgi:hypothetical protein
VCARTPRVPGGASGCRTGSRPPPFRSGRCRSRAATGAALVPGTARPVTFGGSAGAVVPAGDGLHLSGAGYRALADAVDVTRLTGSQYVSDRGPARVALADG